MKYRQRASKVGFPCPQPFLTLSMPTEDMEGPRPHTLSPSSRPCPPSPFPEEHCRKTGLVFTTTTSDLHKIAIGGGEWWRRESRFEGSRFSTSLPCLSSSLFVWQGFLLIFPTQGPLHPALPFVKRGCLLPSFPPELFIGQ